MKLIRNAILCNHCDQLIVSRHRHEMVTCGCAAVSVDGGNAYKRRGFIKDGDYQEACAYSFDQSVAGELVGKWLVFSPQGKTNPGVAFDRQVDACESAESMAAAIGGDSTWYVTLIFNLT